MRDPETVVRGQTYVDLNPDRTPRAFYVGGINSPAQIPEDAVAISRELHRLWTTNTNGQALALDGRTLEPAPEKVMSLDQRKDEARKRVREEADVRGRTDVARVRGRAERVRAATVAQARAVDGSIGPGEFPFVDAYHASSGADDLAASVLEILAVADAELAADAATELDLQTTIARINAATDRDELEGVSFPGRGERAPVPR